MKKIEAEKADEYFDEASNWDTDQVMRSKQAEKKAWRVAAVGLFIATLSVGANFTLFPLKQVEYRIIRVDNTTGMVDVQRTVMTGGKESYGEVTDKYWLRRYVRTREGYLYDEYNNIYREVGLLSSSQEQKKWYAYFRPENPIAPVNVYSNKVRVKIKIRSVVMIGKNLANVHFTKTAEQTGAAPAITNWVATIPYRYVVAPQSEDDREVNPLGFQVTDGYRIDPETGVTTTDNGGVLP